ncbi:uncharacterized protein LOC131860101 [Cryptomeria japonica]|uniref:uncharacterized protein LOC131860101 n=1 Tax=Cryptomeria japonica TaxID=3369 RepID=UPI0027DA7EE8|nr:uncharacterized protein LOC131860101 [Cryptomeria japonica]
MAGRVKEIADKTTDKWDILFVEREKKEEKERQKVDKSFTKDTPSVISKAPTHVETQPEEEKVGEETKDDIDLESEIIFTMNVDTEDFNIVMDKETTEVKKSETIPDDTQLNIEILIEAEAKTETGTRNEQSISEPTDIKTDRKVENKNKNKEGTMDKEEVKNGSKEAETVKESREEEKKIAESSTLPRTSTMDYRPMNVTDVVKLIILLDL